ncbi:ROK family protein [Alkalihalobacillus deserti]|uniref:ROK family protein n=1 Tax=Alkalihalobacillus deserti TaxID=2879466 RepID=UPI001D13C23D|nr:ROK family transcriptional regulator [Alkalihalobacillus deserti]
MLLKDFLESGSTKQQELKRLYQLIRKNGPITKAELMELTKIKKTKLNRMIDELLKNNFLREYGVGDTSIGRPPTYYDVVLDKDYIIGIHISKMAVEVVLCNVRYEIIEEETFAITSIHTLDFIINKITGIIRRLMKDHKIGIEHLIGIGFATVGPIDKKKGMIIVKEPFFAQNWKNTLVVDMLQHEFPVKIMLELATETAVVAEYDAYDSVHKNVLYLISGAWGLGCGVIINGTLLPGQNDNYEHMSINFDGKLCSCGKRGCLVAYSSFKGIIQDLKKDKSTLGLNDAQVQQVSVNDLIEYFKQGDEKTKEIILNTADYLGFGLSNLINIFQAELIILSGPLIYNFDGYFNRVVESALQNLKDRENDLIFTTGKRKDRAMVVGACITLFESYFPKTF